MSYEDRKANREQMLGVTKEDLIALADQLDHAVSEAAICVVGSREAIDSCGMTDITIHS